MVRQDLSGGKGHVLVGSDEGSSFCVSDVLHLMPPLFDSCLADVPHVTNEGHRRGADEKVCLVMLGPMVPTRNNIT